MLVKSMIFMCLLILTELIYITLKFYIRLDKRDFTVVHEVIRDC